MTKRLNLIKVLELKKGHKYLLIFPKSTGLTRQDISEIQSLIPELSSMCIFVDSARGIKAIHASKMHDYSEGNGYGNLEAGANAGGVEDYIYPLQRAEEKLFRIISLFKQDVAPEHESIMDSFGDITSLIAIAIDIYERR